MFKWIRSPKSQDVLVPVLACDECGAIMSPDKIGWHMARYEAGEKYGVMRIVCKCIEAKKCNYPDAENGDLELKDFLILLARNYNTDRNELTCSDLIDGLEPGDIESLDGEGEISKRVTEIINEIPY